MCRLYSTKSRVVCVYYALTSGTSWNTAELDNDPVAKPKSNRMTVFFFFGSLSNGQNMPPTNPDKLITPTDNSPPIQAENNNKVAIFYTNIFGRKLNSVTG